MIIKNMHYIPQKMLKLKIFFSIILLVLLIVQISSICSIVGAMTVEYRHITVEDMDDLKSGELVQGTVDASDIIMNYQDATISGNIVECISVLTSDRNVIVIAANPTVAPDMASEVHNIQPKSDSSIRFRGKVGRLSDTYRTSLMMNMLMDNKYKEYNIDERNISWTAITLVDNDTGKWTALLIASILGLLAILAGIWLLLRKSLNNIIYGLLVQKGVLEPEIKVRKEDIDLHQLDPFASNGDIEDKFYSNDDYETGEINGSYKFADDQDETDTSYQQPVQSSTKPVGEKNEIRDFLASSSFLASTGIFGLVGHELEKENRTEEKVEFYQGGVNEDGNFYVDREENNNEDINGDQRRRY